MRRIAKIAGHLYILSAVVLAVALGLWAGWQALTTYLYVAEVDVPALVGNTPEEAALLVHRASVTLESVERGFHASVQEGQIFWQDPPPGKRVKRGRAVRILVSFGAQKVVVPDLTGRPLQMAQLTLEAATLRVDSITEEYDDVIKRQSVLGQVPPAGALLPVDSAIALIISRGPKRIEGASRTSSSAAEPQSVETLVRP